MKNLLRTAILGLAILSTGVMAGIETRQFNSPEQEQAYKDLVFELRCLVCQNQNLADSNAELAVDLRNEVYKMLQDGKSKQDVLDFMVARYGDFVLYKPPVEKATALLWFGPAVMLAIGLLIAILFIRRHRNQPGEDHPDEVMPEDDY
jgi:cytochrome c-type biogenesis protein CcmH